MMRTRAPRSAVRFQVSLAQGDSTPEWQRHSVALSLLVLVLIPLLWASINVAQWLSVQASGSASDLGLILGTLAVAVFIPQAYRGLLNLGRRLPRKGAERHRTLLEFASEVRTMLDPPALHLRLLEEIVAILGIEYAALYLPLPDGRFYLAEALHLPRARTYALLLSTEARSQLAQGLALGDTSGYSLLVPLIAERLGRADMAGLLALGPRLRDQGYSREEYQLLAHLASQAGTAIAVAARAEQQRQDLEAANRRKESFLAIVSHELRTPLHAIIGYTDVLLNGLSGPVNAQQQASLERVIVSAGQLRRLIDELISITQARAADPAPRREPIEVAAWAREVRAQISILAERRNLHLSLYIDPRLPAVILGDDDLLRQVAFNLLSNAIKFTERGRIEIGLQQQGANTWALIIMDTGCGISESDQQRIFEHYQRASAPEGAEGSGLGLAITRRLVQRMGGTIRVDSIVGEGSTFTVLLPLKTPREARYAR